MRTAASLHFLLALFFSPQIWAADSNPPRPCTILSPTSGAYFDLNQITVQPLKNHKKVSKDARTESWHARGYDYGTNFTLNFCAPVIEPLEEVVGIHEDLVKNVSAFYTYKDKTYSIGFV